MSPKFITYPIDENTTIEVMLPDGYEAQMPTPLTRGGGEEESLKSSKTFQEALGPFFLAALWMKEKMHDLAADETELKFGLVTTGELGNFAIGKVGVEANYEVTLKWKKKDDDDLHKQIAAIRARGAQRRVRAR